nr:hypothetical protein [Candidatus Syntrophosphaera sp.]
IAKARDLRGIPSSPGLERVKALLRQSVPRLEEDRISYPDVNAAIALLSSGAIFSALAAAGVDLY